MEHPRQILEYVISYKAANDGNSPTIREIMSALGHSSTSRTAYWLRELERDGLVELEPGRSRIVVRGGKWTHPTLET